MLEKVYSWVCINMLERAIFSEDIANIDYWMNKFEEGPDKLNFCLVYACENSKIESVKYLLKLNADVNCANNLPLCLAIKSGSIETMKLLVKSGATVSGIDLVQAIINFKKDIVKYIIEEYGVDINCDNGRPLREAAFPYYFYCEQRISMEILDYLISKGADLKLAIKSSADSNIKHRLLSKYLLQKFEKGEL